MTALQIAQMAVGFIFGLAFPSGEPVLFLICLACVGLLLFLPEVIQ